MADKKTSRTIKLYIDGKEVEGSVKNINSRVRQLTAEMNKLTIGTKEYEAKAAEIRKLNGILDEHRRKLRGVGDETKNTSGMFGKMTDMIKGKFKGMGESSLGSFNDMLGGMQGSWMKFAGWIGAAVAALKLAFEAGKWWYNYNMEVEEAQRLTREFLGLTGKDLRYVQTQISAVAKSMGKEYKEVLETVDMMTKHFGVTAEEAIETIKDGLQAGGDLNGTLLQQIKQFGPAARDAGQSVEELVAMIVQTRSGIFNEQGMAMVQTAENKLRQMTSKTAASLDAIGVSSKKMEADLKSGQMTMYEAVQMVAQALQELPQNSAEVGQAMKNVFGQTAANEGMAMIDAIANMTTNMEDLMAVTGEYGEIQRQQIEAEAELNEKMEEYFGLGDQGFQELTGKAKLYFTKGLIVIVEWTKKAINKFVEWYNKSLLLRAAIHNLSIPWRIVWVAAKNNINFIITGFKQLGRTLEGFHNALQGVFKLDPKLFAKGLTQLLDPRNVLKDLKSDVSNLFKDAAEQASSVWNLTMDSRLKPIEEELEPETGPEVTVYGHRHYGGSTSDDGSGKKGGKTGKTGKKTNAEAEERKRQAEERKRIQEELTAIDVKYAEERRKLQERYMRGEIESKEELSRQLESLERQELDEKLAIVGLEEKQRSALKDKLIAMQKKLYEQLQDVVADLADQEKDSSEKKLDDLLKQENRQREIIEEAHKQELIDEETYQSALAGLEAKYSKRRHDLQYDQDKQFFEQDILARKLAGVKAGQTEEKIAKDIAEMRKRHLEQMLEDTKLNAEQRAEVEKQLADEYLEEHTETMGKINELVSTYTSMIDTAMEDIFDTGIKGLKNFAKEILKTVLDAVEKQILAQKAAILAEELASKSWAGVASAAGMMALIATAFAAAKAAIGSWEEGGYTGKGGKREVAGIVHKGEYVLPQEAVNNPAMAPLLDAVESARARGTLGKMTQAELAASYLPRLSMTRSRVTPNTPPRRFPESAGAGLGASRSASRSDSDVLKDVAAAVRDLRERLERPIEAQTHLLGKGGVNEAQDKLTRMMDNAKRN